MAGDLSEDVLRDLLLKHGIEGVTLWHIKALAAYLHGMKVCGTQFYPTQRLDSDLRGEDFVWQAAITTNNLHDNRWKKFRASRGAAAATCNHDFTYGNGLHCNRCGVGFRTHP